MESLRHIVDLMRRGRWKEAHDLVQEGDLEDAEYWYGNANRHFRSRGTLEEELALFEAALMKPVK
jgi:hypothetical protein